MKVTNVQSPHQVKQVVTNEAARTAKMVNAFNKASQTQEVPAQPQVTPQENLPINVNPNNVGVEELSAITGQNRNTEDTSQTTSSPTPEPKTPTQKDDPSAAMQLLARKERQLRQQAEQQKQSLKQKESLWAQEKAALETRLQELEKTTISRQRIKDEAYDVLSEEGVSYDDITKQAMDAQQKNPRYEGYIKRLEAKIAKLEQDSQSRDQQAQEQQSQSYKAAVSQIRQDTRKLVDSDPNYETIKATNSIQDVVELIELTFKEEGRVLSVDEAADLVEEHLLEESMKIANLDKVKKRIAAKNASSTQSPKTQQQPQQTQQMKTLTNASSSTRKLSSRERALLAFRGELK